ncbi:sensor histidine kinase [Albimonas pacifica]|uniref:histidine kinase n=1 Tax=Albimonas pacifica TaxID=1114924 RepID=A0A1I3D3D5_9RHOB|nr:PAS domain-containing sensor histidine kinase [Albimonas pacifica]SFH81207.1 PAS fold [Albimonas pacifica]
MLELAEVTALLTAAPAAALEALRSGNQLVLAVAGGCAGAVAAALGLRTLRLRAGHPGPGLAGVVAPGAAGLGSRGLRPGAGTQGGEAGLGFHLEGGRLRARDRAARGFLGDETRPLDDFTRRLTPVEGAMDLGLALRALEADGRPFRTLADDDEGRSWEIAGRPEAGEARLVLVPAGPSRREIARLRGMLAMLAADRDQATEALEAAPLLAWRRSPAGHVVWGNALYRRIAGAEEAHGSDAAPLPELHHDGGESRGARPPEGRRSVFDARTGERRWYELAELPASDGGELGYGVDAAAAVHAEGALRRFVETLTETFAHLAIGLAIFDRETRLGLFNPAFASLMRLDPAWLAGRPSLSDVLERLRAERRLPDHEDFQRWRADMLGLFRAEGGQERPERTEVWHLPGELQIRVVARPHPQGAVAFLFEDVSETARLERRFATETEIRRAVMDRLEEGVIAFGPDGAARFVNPAFAAIWRPRAEDLDGGLDDVDVGLAEGGAERLRLPQALEMFRARSGAAAVWDRLAEFFGAPADRAAWSEEVSLTDGRRLRVRVAALPDGSVLAAFTDVTDTARAELATRERTAALEAAEEIRGALLEQVSGRVRTPLARILGLGLALRDEAEDAGAEPGALERIDAILEAASQVQAALSGVADLASAQAGVLSLTPETVDLRAALVAALDMAQRRAAERGVTLSLEPAAGAEGGEQVLGDAARVRQLLFNLVTDAVHRAGAGDEVRAGACRRGGEIEIWTEAPDDGAPSDAGPAPGEPRHGGLAHALVRRFSELHGGSVRTERLERAGALRRRVICTLPAEALRAPAPRRAPAVA